MSEMINEVVENKFVPGARVVALWNSGDYITYNVAKHHNSDDDDYTFISGVILSLRVDKEFVVVQWDKGTDFCYEDDDATSEEVLVDLLTLESEQVSLEEEFNSVTKQIEDKVEEACKLIAEANAIAEQIGTCLHDLDDSNYSLRGALRDSGWNTSSWYC